MEVNLPGSVSSKIIQLFPAIPVCMSHLADAFQMSNDPNSFFVGSQPVADCNFPLMSPISPSRRLVRQMTDFNTAANKDNGDEYVTSMPDNDDELLQHHLDEESAWEMVAHCTDFYVYALQDWNVDQSCLESISRNAKTELKDKLRKYNIDNFAVIRFCLSISEDYVPPTDVPSPDTNTEAHDDATYGEVQSESASNFFGHDDEKGYEYGGSVADTEVKSIEQHTAEATAEAVAPVPKHSINDLASRLVWISPSALARVSKVEKLSIVEAAADILTNIKMICVQIQTSLAHVRSLGSGEIQSEPIGDVTSSTTLLVAAVSQLANFVGNPPSSCIGLHNILTLV